ncbi:transcriptional regulator [uncultured archaeal virus]|uniref:Transcriptional regulator n=1 Tax=uncultured archaeal virus TaxID=1960247 RepID=A0A8B0LPZ0_9VIRU|nr:transcriptional regulator [uncultured archaeal virus]
MDKQICAERRILEMLSKDSHPLGLPAVGLCQTLNIKTSSIYAPLNRLLVKGLVVKNKLNIKNKFEYNSVVTSKKKSLIIFQITDRGKAKIEYYKK